MHRCVGRLVNCENDVDVNSEHHVPGVKHTLAHGEQQMFRMPQYTILRCPVYFWFFDLTVFGVHAFPGRSTACMPQLLWVGDLQERFDLVRIRT